MCRIPKGDVQCSWSRSQFERVALRARSVRPVPTHRHMCTSPPRGAGRPCARQPADVRRAARPGGAHRTPPRLGASSGLLGFSPLLTIHMPRGAHMPEGCVAGGGKKPCPAAPPPPLPARAPKPVGPAAACPNGVPAAAAACPKGVPPPAGACPKGVAAAAPACPKGVPPPPAACPNGVPAADAA